MYRIVFGILALTSASPALAQDRTPLPPQSVDAAKVGALLSNPLVQELVASSIDQYADALLQTHVGPLAKLADTRDHVRPEDTLGDLAARDHPNYRRDLHEQARSAVAATGQAARDMASLSAEMRQTTARLRALLAQTQAEVDAVR